MKRPCKACRGVGFRLMDNDTHGLRIERCDACRRFKSDDSAVKAAFGAALGSRMKRRRHVVAKDVRQRWDLACGCKHVERSVYVEPTFYAMSGTPICQECGQDRQYVRTEVR